jgi:hypothetical protein
MMDLKTLELAFAPIQEIGEGELSFDAEGFTLVVRTLIPDEEVECARYASEAVPEGTTDPSSAIDYVDRYRRAVLSYALVQIGDTDLRGVRVVSTGELLSNGKPKSIPKHEAVRQLLQAWSKPLLARCLSQFHHLINEVEKRVREAIQYTPSDIDAEIEALQERIQTLKAEKEEQLKGLRSAFHRTIEDIDTLPPVQEAPAQAPQEAPAPRVPISPTSIQGAPPAPSRAQVRQPAPPQPIQDSFLGEDHEAAIAAETQRVLARRQQTDPRLPVGQIDGTDVFQMPVQVLEAPTEQPPTDRRHIIDAPPVPGGGSANPRFQPRKV